MKQKQEKEKVRPPSLSIYFDPELAERINERRAELSASVGIPVSMSAMVCLLVRQALLTYDK